MTDIRLIRVDAGARGPAATVEVGSTSTLSPGSSATVTNSGDSSDATLDFGIPEGVKGDTGDAWNQWQGTWDNSTAYSALDAVSHHSTADHDGAALWVANQDTNAGDEPTLASAKWDLAAAPGEDGTGSPSDATPQSVDAASQSGGSGSNATFSRSDHEHPSGAFADDPHGNGQHSTDMLAADGSNSPTAGVDWDGQALTDAQVQRAREAITSGSGDITFDGSATDGQESVVVATGTGSRTFDFANVPASGPAALFTVYFPDGAPSITWSGTWVFAGGEAPSWSGAAVLPIMLVNGDAVVGSPTEVA